MQLDKTYISSDIGQILPLSEESFEVEYKSASGGFPKSFWETFSAFANSDGGVIILGVREKQGRFIADGLTEEQATAYQKKFWDDAHNKSCVSVPLLMEQDVAKGQLANGEYLLSFRIPRASYDMRPVYLTPNPLGHTYKRRHEGDYLCNDDEVRQMFADANSLKYPADARILRGFTMEDIDLATLHNYRRAYNNKHEGHPWTEVSDEKFLENIGAYRRDRQTSTKGFTVAGMLMFGKNASITDPECCPYYFVDYRERLSVDPQIRWTNRIYPDGNWEGNLYQFFTRVLPQLQQALPVPFKLDENLTRVDTTTAHSALREALANTIIHCAYTVMGNITIDRFSDRIVMSNPGTMLISVQEFMEGNHSVCRNPNLQKMFVLIGVGEKAGSGADIMLKGWKDNGWQQPTVKEVFQPDRVEITLFLDTKEESTQEGADASQKSVEKSVEKILKAISDKPQITVKELTEIVGLSRRGVEKNIKKLQEQGVLRRVGPDKGGHWEIIKK